MATATAANVTASPATSPPHLAIFHLLTKPRGKRPPLDLDSAWLQVHAIYNGVWGAPSIPVAEPAVHFLARKPWSGELLRNFVDAFGLAPGPVADLLDATPKTVRTRKTAAKLPAADVERIIRYVRVWAAASETFEDRNYASAWMHKVNEALGGVTPASLLVTGDGERMVLNELGRIEHGIPV